MPLIHRSRVAARTVATAAVAAAALLVTACAASPAPPAATETLTVMVISNDEPGPQLPQGFPEVANGARAAAAQINDAGGVDGRQIEIEHCETGGDPNVAVQCAQQAAADKVAAVVGSFDLVENSLSVLDAAGIPSIAPWVAGEVALTTPTSYPITGGGYANMSGLITALAERGADSVAAVFSSVSASQAQALIDTYAEVRSEPSVELVVIPQNTIDYSAPVATAEQYDGITLGATENEIVAFLKVLYQTGEDHLVSTFPLTPQALSDLGEIGEGSSSISAFYPASSTDNEAVTEYLEYMEQIDPNGAIDEFSANAYAAVQIFAQAATGVDDVTAAAIIERLDSGVSFDPKLTPEITFSDGASTVPSLTRFFNPNVVQLRAEDGVYVIDGDFFNAYTGEPAS